MSVPAVPPPSNPTSDTGLPSNLASGICAAAFPPIAGVIFYFIEKKDSLVRHWAVQTIFFGCTWIVLWVAVAIVSQLLIHIIPILGIICAALLGLAYHIGGFALWLIGVIRAFQGTRWEYPIISEQCKKLFPKLVP